MFALAVQPIRVPILAVLLLALSAFAAGGYAMRLVESPMPAVQPRVITIVKQPAPVSNACTDGTAYVTGDMVGDASPADVLKAMCP